MSIQNISTEAEFNNLISINERKIIIIHFGAAWAPQCKQINDILSEFKDNQPNCLFFYIEAQKIPSLSLKYKVTAVPTILFLKRNQVMQVVQGGNPRDLLKAIKELTNIQDSPVKTESTEEQLKSLINSDVVMLFMKGSPNEPKCGFSRKIIQILKDCDVEFKSFDILTNSEVREELKKFSNLPTYPQLYIKGELIGGLDICQELFQSGELNNLIKEAKSTNISRLNERLMSLVRNEKVMLFMKGSPETPKCGFSRNTVEILNKSRIKFGHFDILTDEEIRQGLKTLFNWPTYPQLYVNGELIGGYDIIKELDESGDIVSTCN